eukprot:TRINITY_DN30564_c0_g1_i1.p1 TRINITY_DN30564_c0_g1~~TRINITY_DN30564_c0_g1_i1.p1  ORF type:complete len:280 (-),score=48.11 TRINITY_DN30564_c0_g1_i1:289-1128(-)
MISLHPLVQAQLLFEPEGRKAYADMAPAELQKQQQADSFYTQQRANVCVVCGAAANLHRFHVVPSRYRRHFPVEFKSHASHDVVLCCVACAEGAGKLQYQRDKELKDRYRVKHDEHTQIPETQAKVAQKAAKALLGDTRFKIPAARRGDLEQCISDFVESEASLGAGTELVRKAGRAWEDGMRAVDRSLPFTGDQLASVHDFKPCPGIPRSDPGQLIVQAVEASCGVAHFIKEWRTLFLQAEPRFLPQGWGVDSKTSRAFGKHSRFHCTSTDSGKPQLA